MGFDLGDALRLGKKISKKGAPLIGTLIGGSAGEMVGDVISGIFGGEKDVKKIEKMLDKSPELYAELVKFELNHKVDLEKLKIEEKRVELANLESARSREVAIVQGTGKKDKLMDVISVIIVGGFLLNTMVIVILMAMGLFQGLAQGLVLLLGSIEGTFAAGFMAVIGYYYGSSKGSSDKNDMLDWNNGGNK